MCCVACTMYDTLVRWKKMIAGPRSSLSSGTPQTRNLCESHGLEQMCSPLFLRSKFCDAKFCRNSEFIPNRDRAESFQQPHIQSFGTDLSFESSRIQMGRFECIHRPLYLEASSCEDSGILNKPADPHTHPPQQDWFLHRRCTYLVKNKICLPNPVTQNLAE